MRSQQVQRFRGMLSCRAILSISQVRFGKRLVCVGRVRISRDIELQDLDRQL